MQLNAPLTFVSITSDHASGVSLQSATARPSPVAPPVTMTTRPRRDSALFLGWGRSCTTGAAASRPPDDHGYGLEGLKGFEPMFELEHRQAASQLTARAGSHLGDHFRTGRGRVWRARAGPRRNDQRRLAVDRRRLYVRRRLPLLLEIPRHARLRPRSPTRDAGGAIQQRP